MRNNFFWSHTLLVAQQGGYGRLYNWYCTQTQYTKVKYGYLYNWYAATDSRSITADDNWRIPSYPIVFNGAGDLYTLGSYIGGSSNGSKLLEQGSKYWDYSNGTDSFQFHARGSGRREESGEFISIKNVCEIWTSKSVDTKAVISSMYVGYFQYPGTSYNSYYKNKGLSIRLLRNSTTLTNGQTGTYTGNDGKVYKTICIGTQEWLSENLVETKYRNGDLIPIVTDNTTWSTLTTGARCAYNNDEANAFETVSIAPVGFHVPTNAEFETLITTVGGLSVAGGKLKETGFTHWLTPNTGADDSSRFSAIGTGVRDNYGVFRNIKYRGYYLTSTSEDATTARMIDMFSNNATVNNGYAWYALFKTEGRALRLLKNDSTFTPGDTVTDIDGNIYPLVKIGTQVWMAENLKVQHYNDGTPIPNVTDSAAWAALTTGAQCVYNNDIKNL